MCSQTLQKQAAKENAPLIVFDKVCKQFDSSDGSSFTALDRVSLSVNTNEFFTLLGPSGCGKTTLLRTLAGFESPTSGAIRLNGQDVTALPANKRPVNTVFQSYALFPHMTVRQNIAFGPRMLGKPATEIDRVTTEMLDLVQLGALSDRKPAQLSGGQQQRVALARALASAPQVLLLDEPLSALDLKLRKEMQIEMKRIQRDSHTTFLFVTHDQEEALTMSDRIAVMDQGRVQQIGSPNEIYNNPTNNFVAGFVGDMNFIAVQSLSPLDNGLVAAETPIGRLAATSAGDATATPAPGAVKLAVRPEKGRLIFGGAESGENRVRVEIVNVVFTGPFASVMVQPETGQDVLRVRVEADNPAYPRCQVGASAVLELPPAALRALS